MVVPLISHAYSISLPDNAFSPFPLFRTDVDLFAASKVQVLLFLSLACVVLWSVRPLNFFKEVLKHKNSILLLFGFLVFVWLPLLRISPYRWTSIFGFAGQYEGALAFTSYVVLAIHALTRDWSEKSLRILSLCVSVSSLAVAILCILQFFDKLNMGEEPLRTLFFGTIASKANLGVTWGQRGMMSGTLYNPNFAAMYAAVVVSYLSLHATGASKGFRTEFVAAVLSFCVVLGSGSRMALAATLLSLTIGMFMLFKSNNLQRGRFAALLTFFIVAGFIFGGRGALVSKMQNTMSDGFRVVSHFRPESVDVAQRSNLGLFVEKGVAYFRHANHITIFRPNGNSIAIIDGKANVLQRMSPECAPTCFTFEQGEFRAQRDPNTPTIDVLWAGRNLKLIFDNVGVRLIAWNMPHFSERPRLYDIFGPAHFFSGRAYIWARSIPLALDAPLLGSGYGVFPYLFPQRDFQGKITAFNDHEMIVDKPHNLYLQIAIGGGIISLIIFLTLVWRSLRQLNRHSGVQHIALATATLTYLLCGLCYDSTVFVSPIFWVLLGASLTTSAKREI